MKIFRRNCKIKYSGALIIIIILSMTSYNITRTKGLNEVSKKSDKTGIPKASINFKWDSTIPDSIGTDLVIDSNNKIFIVGKKYNVSTNSNDILIVRYNNSGGVEWNKTWGGNYNDVANAISIDTSNNIYIVGGSNSFSSNNTDIVVIKYNNLGELEWYRLWGGTQWDMGYGIVIDSKDNLYIIGYTESHDILGDVVLLKYNSSGFLKFNKTWGGLDTDCAYDITLDNDNNIYFTGYTSSFGAVTSNLFLVKYDNNSLLQWNITWGDILPDEGRKLEIDHSNNIFVLGNTQNIEVGSYDIILLKFNSSSDLLWNTTWGGSEHDYGLSLTLDSMENILIGGFTESFNSIEKDAFLLKIDQTGNLKWYKTSDRQFNDYIFGIEVDNLDNIFTAGNIENADNIVNILFSKYSPIPDGFILFSNADSPDPDGTFTLSWTYSLDADNYSLYQSNRTITKINSSVLELVHETPNRLFSLSNLEEGFYYFLVIAFNKYGSIFSNRLKISVQYPPKVFTLMNHSHIPDTDGIINLTWSKSVGAKNYSIYIDNENIADIEKDGTLIAYGIIQTYYLVENLTNGDYYFIIIAYNEAGIRLSNCIYVNVRRAPNSLKLYTYSKIPNTDGEIELIWTFSKYAQHYILYFSNQTFSEVNDSIEILTNYNPSFDWPIYRYEVSGLVNGTYFFKVFAFNEFGNTSSKCLKIVISIPEDSSDPYIKKISPLKLPPQIVLYSVLIGLIGILSFIYLKRKHRFLK